MSSTDASNATAGATVESAAERLQREHDAADAAAAEHKAHVEEVEDEDAPYVFPHAHPYAKPCNC